MLNSNVLYQNILSYYRNEMKKLDSQAQPTEFQEILLNAIAQSLVISLQKAIIKGSAPYGNWLGVPAIGLKCNANIMSNTCINKMTTLIKQQPHKYFKTICNAIYTPLSNYIQTNAEIYSISGFGGQGVPPIGGIIEIDIFNNIINNLQKYKKSVLKSQHGQNFIKAISHGMYNGLMQATIPFVQGAPPSQSSGLLVGKIK